MTTEVLRNMIYAGSRQLADLGFVVMDEVHYLADRFRGAVWEEVILQLPEHVALVSLSATVSNAEEFGDWLVTVRGDTAVVVDEHRPVPLWQHMMVGSRMYDMFGQSADGELVGRPGAGPPDRRRWSASSAVWDRGRAAGAAPPRHPVPAAVAGHGHRPARPRRPAARHHVRVQPRGLRRRRRPVRALRAAAHHRGRGGADPRDDRPPHRRAAAGRPRRAGLLGVARGPGARHRRPPRGHAARVQGDRRGAVRPRPRPRGVRHRDARAGHQHARPHRGAGTAREVQRREPRRAHARASTRSSPGGPGGAASTSRATRW